MGMEASLTKDDPVITAYRAHGWTYTRGVPPVGVLAELTGKNKKVNNSNYYINFTVTKLIMMWVGGLVISN